MFLIVYLPILFRFRQLLTILNQAKQKLCLQPYLASPLLRAKLFSSVFNWLGPKPKDYGPSEYRTCSVFKPPLYCNIVTLDLFNESLHVLVIQWGSEIRPSLDFEWSKRGWVANSPDFKWDLKSGSSTIWNPDKYPPFSQKPFEILTKTSVFWMVLFSTGWDYSYGYLKSELQKVGISNRQILDPHCIA